MGNIADGLLEIYLGDEEEADLMIQAFRGQINLLSYGGEADFTISKEKYGCKLGVVFSCKNSCEVFWDFLSRIMKCPSTKTGVALINSKIQGKCFTAGISYKSIISKNRGCDVLSRL